MACQRRKAGAEGRGDPWESVSYSDVDRLLRCRGSAPIVGLLQKISHVRQGLSWDPDDPESLVGVINAPTACSNVKGSERNTRHWLLAYGQQPTMIHYFGKHAR